MPMAEFHNTGGSEARAMLNRLQRSIGEAVCDSHNVDNPSRPELNLGNGIRRVDRER